MTIDEYDEMVTRTAQARAEAWERYNVTIGPAKEKLAQAESEFLSVENPAWDEYQRICYEAIEAEHAAFEAMWNQEMERQQAHNEFVLGLLSSPDEATMIAKLEGKIQEEDHGSSSNLEM